jgi:hypothetical protein
MTTARAWVALLAAMLVASLGLLWPHADVGEASSCTRATVAGAYGLTATGVLIAPTGSRV